jgi:hypothetical protein
MPAASATVLVVVATKDIVLWLLLLFPERIIEG